MFSKLIYFIGDQTISATLMTPRPMKKALLQWRCIALWWILAISPLLHAVNVNER